MRVVKITEFPHNPSRRIDKRFWSWVYFDVIHRVEWNGRWGRFIPLRQDENGKWFEGVGVEYLDTRWWAAPFKEFVANRVWARYKFKS